MMTMTILNRDAILGAQDLKTEDVIVEQWGGAVRIALMSGLARDQFMSSRDKDNLSLSDFQASILAATVVDADGALIFTPTDIVALQGKNKDVLDVLTAAALRLNSMGPAASDDAVKNSEADQSDASGSGSPETSAKASSNSSVK
jgi:hypothetical protein